MSSNHNHGHNHGHGHDHGKTSSQKTLLLALVITLAYAAVEAVGGWLANSLALIGDAGHMLSDAAALGVGALAAWLAKRSVGALFNVLFMYLIVAAIVVASIRRFAQPEPVDFQAVIIVGGIGLAINLLVAWLLNRGESTLNTRGALLHVMGDLLGSVAAIAAGVVIWLTGWMPIDPLLSLLVCLLIVVSATRLLLESLRVVMEAVPPGLEVAEVRQGLLGVSAEVTDIHHLHIWAIGSDMIAMSAHVALRDTSQWPIVMPLLLQRSKEAFAINHCTFQPELDSSCPDKLADGSRA